MFWFYERARAFCRNDEAVVVVGVAISSVALVGFLALTVDLGAIYEVRHQLQTGADGAALAGAWELPNNLAAAASKAQEYAGHNGISSGEITITIQSILNPNDGIQVRTVRNVDLVFGRVLNLNAVAVEASATAIAVQLQPKALWPILLPVSDAGSAYTVLSMGPPGSEWVPGTVRATDYPPPGGTEDYVYDFTYGWDDTTGAMPVYSPPDPYSWWIDLKPGNMVNATQDALNSVLANSAAYDPPSCLLADPYSFNPDNPPVGFIPSIACYRIRYFPLVSDASWDAAKGRSQPVEITGFVPTYLIGYDGSGATINIHLVFLREARAMGRAIVGAPLNGLLGARLWR
ncbi:MAG: hypothetical protein HYX92_18390 [Chloroflexi bacterium]|nr:hypothetical protein [Chloroflexota bacterium]